MTVLLLAEVHNGHLNDSTAKALTAAAQLGGPVHILVAGRLELRRSRAGCGQTRGRGQGADG